jgi:hypothetical protein
MTLSKKLIDWVTHDMSDDYEWQMFSRQMFSQLFVVGITLGANTHRAAASGHACGAMSYVARGWHMRQCPA